MQHPITRALFEYWNAMRGERIAPRRFEIEPSRIADILPDTFILEQIDRQLYRYRVAGTRLCEGFGTEFRGFNFLDGWTAAERARLKQMLTDITDRGAVGVMAVEQQAAPRQPPRRFEFVVLPLLHTGQVIDRYLGAAVPIDAEGEPIMGLPQSRRLVAADVLTPEALALSSPEPIPPRQPAPLSALVRSARIVRHNRRQFRVYDGGLLHPPHNKTP